MSFKPNEDETAALRSMISGERLQPYLEEASDDIQQAFRLYTWNTSLSAALYGPLQIVEISVRNAVNDAVSPSGGTRWFQNQGLMKHVDLQRVARAKEDLEKRNVLEPLAGQVIAALSFGFWVGCFARPHDGHLWRVHLHKSVLSKPKPRRQEIFDALDPLRTLRNRIAHHERIHHRNLMEDHRRIEDVVRWFQPHLLPYLTYHSRFLEVLASGCEEVERF